MRFPEADVNCGTFINSASHVPPRPPDRAHAGKARRGAAFGRGRASTNPNGTAFARSCFADLRTCTSRAATCGRSIAIFRTCTRHSRRRCRRASLTARLSSPRRMASTSTRSRCGCIPPPRASPSLLPQHPPHSSPSICLPTPGAIFARRPLPSGALTSSGFSPASRLRSISRR